MYDISFRANAEGQGRLSLDQRRCMAGQVDVCFCRTYRRPSERPGRMVSNQPVGCQARSTLMAPGYRSRTFRSKVRTAVIAAALMGSVIATLPVQAQTFTVLHYFTKGPD